MFCAIILDWIMSNANGSFLSQYSLIDPAFHTFNSIRNMLNYISSQIPNVIALNSASALDLVITNYFLFLRVTSISPNKYTTT